MTLSLSVPKIIQTFSKQLISSKDLGYRLARLGIGATITGAGVGTAVSLASKGVAEGGQDISKGFGIGTEWIFIIGAIILVLVLMGGKR